MLDFLIVLAYFGIMLTVGWRARGSAPDGYWVGSRQYGSRAVAASLVATIFGASSTVGIISLGYARGLTGAWWALIGGLALVLFGFLLADKVRGLEVYTLPDILRNSYGDRVAVAGALMITVAWCGVVAAQMVAGAVLMEVLVPFGFRVSLGLVSAVFILYTLWGGQLSVVRTDSWQMVLFVAALTATLGLVWGGGGVDGGGLSAVPQGHWGFPTAEGFGWYDVLVYYPLIVGLPYLVGPDVYSRVLCADGRRSARKAALMAAAGVVPLSLLLALLGTLIRGSFPGVAPDSALTAALTSLAPVGVKGLIVAGLLGAVMSSADTTLMSASTIGSINVVGAFVRLDETQKLRLTRVFVVVLGLVAWGVASFRQEIIGSLLLAYTVFVGGVVVPTLASFWRERLGVTAAGAFWAVLAGGATAILGEVGNGRMLSAMVGESGSAFLASVLGPRFGSLLPLVVSVLILVLVSRLGRRSRGMAVLVLILTLRATGPTPSYPDDSTSSLSPSPPEAFATP